MGICCQTITVYNVMIIGLGAKSIDLIRTGNIYEPNACLSPNLEIPHMKTLFGCTTIHFGIPYLCYIVLSDVTRRIINIVNQMPTRTHTHIYDYIYICIYVCYINICECMYLVKSIIYIISIIHQYPLVPAIRYLFSCQVMAFVEDHPT